MSSSSSPNGQGDPAEEESPKESPVEEASEAVVETVECPNCGRRFVGDYCPGCGQEANPSVSVTGVIGGLFRELVDVESGFWPTLVGLTIRPGKTLRRYLSGERAGLASPGRYLLAAAVVSASVGWLLMQVGAEGGGSVRLIGPGEEAVIQISAEEGLPKGAIPTITIGSGMRTEITVALLMVGPLALLLYRLFAEKLKHMAEALATGCFLVAHAKLLGSGFDLAYELPAFFLAGHPVDSPLYLNVGIPIGYIGIASYGCFGPGWKSALKGAFAIAWSLLEVISLGAASVLIYIGWLARAYPDAVFESGVSVAKGLIVIFLFVLVCLVPVLLHAGVEAYYRLR